MEGFIFAIPVALVIWQAERHQRKIKRAGRRWVEGQGLVEETRSTTRARRSKTYTNGRWQ